MEKMRVSLHGGTVKFYGKIKRKHNDHLHIEKEDRMVIKRVYDSSLRHWKGIDDSELIDDYQSMFYKDFFNEALEKQNERYRKKGNYKRIRNMDEWRKATNHAIREEIMQIGNKGNHPDSKTVYECFREYINWKQRRFKDNLKILSYTYHLDESTPHYHVDEVWFSHDEEGNPVPGVKAALREAGIPLPKPDKKESQRNYRMATVTAECRQKWQEIAMAHGLDIELEPLDREYGHVDTDAYKEIQKAKEALNEREKALNRYKDELNIKERKLSSWEDELIDKETDLNAQIDELEEKKKTYKESIEDELKRQYEAEYRVKFRDLKERQERLEKQILENEEMIKLGRKTRAEQASKANRVSEPSMKEQLFEDIKSQFH